MVVITVSLKDDVAREFRETIQKKIGIGKGVIGRAMEEAIKKWTEEKRQKTIADRQLALMKKGAYSLSGWKFSREEIYARG